MMEDAPVTIQLYRKKWSPRNYDGKYRGPITLREALAESVNTIAVQLSQQVGVDKVVIAARRLGITSDMQEAPSIALGSMEVSLMELTGAYAHLAANGRGVRPYGIVEIRSKDTDEVLYQHDPTVNYIVVLPNIVAEMNSMLMGVIASGTGTGAAIGRPAAGKTGTASDYKDAWFMGYTPALATGVWVGNDDSTPMKKVTGGSLPASIWRNYMSTALVDTVAQDLPTSYVSTSTPSLPWQDGGQPEWPSQGDGQRHAPPPGEEGEVLGKSFWDKLFNDDNPQ